MPDFIIVKSCFFKDLICEAKEVDPLSDHSLCLIFYYMHPSPVASCHKSRKLVSYHEIVQL